MKTNPIKIAYISILFALLGLLTACTPPSPYFKDKSAADIPANIGIIYLDSYTSSVLETNGIPDVDPNPSPDDQAVTVQLKDITISQLKNLGYEVVEDANSPADVKVRLFVYNQPERLLIQRTVLASYVIDDTDGKPIIRKLTGKNNVPFTGSLIGDSRDHMVSIVGLNAGIGIATELRKGTKQNIPVNAALAARPKPALPSK